MGTGLGLGIGIPFRRMGAGIDPQAQAHYDRVIADGGLIPSGLVGVNNFFKTVKAIYGTSDITTAISVGLDAQVLGYKLGAGAGTTAGQAAQKLYSCSGSSGDVVQTTAASQPLLLVHSGANYYFAVDVSGNFVSSNLTYQNDDWDVEFNVKGKYSLSTGRIAGTRSTGEGTNVAVTSTAINLEYRTGGVTYSASANTTNTNDVEYTFRVTRNSATGAVTFIKNGVTLTTSGSQVAGALFSNSYAIQINGVLGGVQGFFGNINWVKFYISGIVVRHFNPNTYNAANSQTQWTSSTGEVWTINTGTAATGYKGVLVDRTIVQGDGIDDNIKNTPFATSANCTDYCAFEQFGWVSSDFIFDGAVVDSIALQQITSIPNIRFEGVNSSAAVSNFIVNTLSLATILGSSSAGSLQLFRNNSSLTIGGTKADSQGYTLFSKANSSNFSNSVINTLIKSLGQNNSTQRTDMYNYIRSINGNSF